MSECEYPKCTREATRLGEEVESCDGSLSVVVDLCEYHWQKCVDYGQECDEREWEAMSTQSSSKKAEVEK